MPAAPTPPCLHLTTLAHGGGTEVNVARLCATEPAFTHRSLESLAGRYPLGLADWLRVMAHLRREHGRCRWRVVFCYGLAAHVAAVLAFAWMPRHRRPVLVGGVRGEVDFAGGKAIVRRLIEPWFECWVSNARATALGRRRVVIHNGVDTPPAHEAPLLEGLARPVIGLLANADSPTGRAVKGHDWMLATWRRLGQPGTLVFAGRLGDDLRRRAQAAGVVCPGFVAAGPLLRSLDLLVVPSTSEGLPTVLLEAMARGVPCLATPVGGIPELLRDGKTGWVRSREQWPALLASMDWDQARRLGAAGRREVERRWTFDRMLGRFRALARHLAARREGR